MPDNQPTDDVRFLIRMAAQKHQDANHAKNDLDRELCEEEAYNLNRIAGRLADYERYFRLLKQVLGDA